MNKLKISILSVSLLTIMANAAIAPAIAVIGAHFNNINVVYVKMLITFPALFIIPISLFSGRLVTWYSKKKLLIVGVSLYLIGGFGAFFLDSFWMIFAFRGILGIGVGLLTPLAIGLIADNYQGEERSKMMGYATSFNNLGGIIATVLAGLLSVISYNYPHLVYSLGFYVLFMIIMYIPDTDPVKTVNRSKISYKIILLGLAMASLMLIFFQIPSHISIYVRELGIGSGLTSGLLISLVTLGSFIFGLMFHRMKSAFGNYTNSIGVLLMLIGNLGIYFTSSIIMLIMYLFIVGVSLGILIPNIYLTASLVSKGDPTFNLGVIASFSFLGQFMSPVITETLLLAFDLNVIRAPYLISSIFGGIGLVVVFCIRRIDFVKE